MTPSLKRGSEGPTSLPIALTPGEPAGIGAEIALKAWQSGGVPRFFLMDDVDRVRARAAEAGLTIPCVPIASAAETQEAWQAGLPILPISFAAPCRPGQPEAANASAVTGAIRDAVTMVQSGAASALVTNPIQKHTLYESGFPHPGHTEFLADLAGGGARAIMLLACDLLRVVPVTIHEALRAAPDLLTQDLIAATVRSVARALIQDFAIADPRIAVAGLNPHAGEAGTIGTEEAAIIQPAIAEVQAEGVRVTGPHPADAMFHAEARTTYDAAVCMYHDQALIPIKTLDFWGGVNVTLGLPFVRTSPDHGTALEIAGSGTARPDSLIAALHMAARIASNRAANATDKATRS